MSRLCCDTISECGRFGSSYASADRLFTSSSTLVSFRADSAPLLALQRCRRLQIFDACRVTADSEDDPGSTPASSDYCLTELQKSETK
jgi:hypothetical protein